MNFVISMIPITNTELAILGRDNHPLGNWNSLSDWMADAQAQRQFGGQPLVEHSYSTTLMPAIRAALGLNPERAEHAVCLSAYELAAAMSRYRMASLNSVEPAHYHTDDFVDQCANTVCAALVHWCPHAYITIDLIGD